MHPIRVLLAMTSADRCQALRAVLQTQQDITVVASEPDPLRVLIAVDETDADVVLIDARTPDAPPPLVDHLLIEYPSLIVIAHGDGMSECALYRFRIDRQTFPDDGGASMLRAIRTSHSEALHL